MNRGGARPGSGRKPGSPNARKALEAMQAVAAAYPGWSPLLYFAQVSNDEELPVEVRLDAAKAAARYMVPVPKPIETDPDMITYLEERLAAIRTEARVDRPHEFHELAERLDRVRLRLEIADGALRNPVDLTIGAPPRVD